MTNNKLPIIKWLIGLVRKEGYECLSISIENVWAMYGNQVRYFLCYNNVSRKFLEKVIRIPTGMDVNWIDQKPFRQETTTEYGWKFYPLKISDNQRELWLDNDIVLFKRHPLIDKFLFGEEELFLFTEDMQRVYSPSSLGACIPKDTKICAGLFGIPALRLADLRSQYLRLLDKNKISKKDTHFTCPTIARFGVENASVALFSLAYPVKYLLIPHANIPVGKAIRQGCVGNFGMHFNGLNRGPKQSIRLSFRMLADSKKRPRRPCSLPPEMLDQ